MQMETKWKILVDKDSTERYRDASLVEARIQMHRCLYAREEADSFSRSFRAGSNSPHHLPIVESSSQTRTWISYLPCLICIRAHSLRRSQHCGTAPGGGLCLRYVLIFQHLLARKSTADAMTLCPPHTRDATSVYIRISNHWPAKGDGRPIPGPVQSSPHTSLAFFGFPCRAVPKTSVPLETNRRCRRFAATAQNSR